jgi:hypothetical protein
MNFVFFEKLQDYYGSTLGCSYTCSKWVRGCRFIILRSNFCSASFVDIDNDGDLDETLLVLLIVFFIKGNIGVRQL